jgi:hypothetical protein
LYRQNLALRGSGGRSPGGVDLRSADTECDEASAGATAFRT